MRIATSPINWNNEDVPDYRPHVSYPRILDEVVAAGYTATEWSSSLPADPPLLRRDLMRRKLTMLGAFCGLGLRHPEIRSEEIHKALGQAAFLKEIGGRFLVVADSGDQRRWAAAGHVTPDLGLPDDQWESLTGGLDELGGRVRQLGLTLVFHNHVGTYVETAEETARLLEQTDPERVSWCLDCGHLAYGGGDTLEMLQQFGERVAYCHLKDVDGRILSRAQAEGWSFSDALRRFIFTPLGKGMAQIPLVVEALRSARDDTWAVIEQDTTAFDPTEIARANREYLVELLG